MRTRAPQRHSEVVSNELCDAVSECCIAVIVLWSRGMSLWQSLLCNHHSVHSDHTALQQFDRFADEEAISRHKR